MNKCFRWAVLEQPGLVESGWNSVIFKVLSPLKPCFLNPPLVTLPKSSLSSGFGWFCLFPHASIHSFEWRGLTKNTLLVHCNWGMMGFVSAPFFMSLAECWCCIKMSLSGWMALEEKGAAEFPAGRSILRSPGSSRKKSVGIKNVFNLGFFLKKFLFWEWL